MARGKRKASGPPEAPEGALLTTESSSDDVLAWLQREARLPKALVAKLGKMWEDRGELVDGETLLQASVELLQHLGCTLTVADRIHKRVQEQLQGSQQALAPGTEEQQVAAGGSGAQRGAHLATQPTQLQQTQSQQPQSQIKPDPEQVEAEAAAWQQQLPGRRQSRRQRSQPPEEPPQQQAQPDDAEEDDQEQEEYEYADEEMGEEEEEAAGVAAGRVKEEQMDGAAVDEHAMPLTGTGGRTTRRQSRRQQQQQQQAPTATQQEQEQEQEEGGAEEGEEEEAAGPSTRRNVLTRRQTRQHVEQQQLRETRRQMRLSTMNERQRRQAEGAEEEDEIEDEEEPQQQQQQQQQQQEDQVDMEESWEEDAEEVVEEDLGPKADNQQYKKDWKTRCRWGLQEIFASMSFEQLREMLEDQEEWPDIARNCLRKKRKVEGVMAWVELKPKKIAERLANFIFLGDPEGGRETEEGGLHIDAIKELLREYCDEEVKHYVNRTLKLRYQNVPRVADPHKLMWHLWQYPLGPANDVCEVLLGSKSLEYESITTNNNELEPPAAMAPFTPWPRVWAALEAGSLKLKDHEDWSVWLTHLNDLSTHPKVKVTARLVRQPNNRRLELCLYALLTKDSLSSALVSGTWKRVSAETREEELVAVDLRFLLSLLDGFEGTPFMQQMDKLTDDFEATEREVTEHSVESELGVENPINFKQFDRVMACVENIDRGEPAGFKETCDEAFLLMMRPYQRRALAHWIAEETAAGGSARHLWVKLNLPEQPDIHCYVSPILHQIRISTSKTEIEHWINSLGGAGWQALQMGMGKTFLGVGAIQMNKPPADWRKNRKYQTLRRRDHLASIINNMPHGDTLIVAPPTLIDQWEDEVRKSTQADLTILKWTETSKKHPRLEDCRKIAKYDIVLTTPQLASNLHTLSHIYWWRIIVDEPQLNTAGFLADSKHPWFARHRWLLTGTPINATVDSMNPSLEFLKLGTFDALYKHFPPVITHVLKRFMVRYTKEGMLDGEVNLELLPIKEELVECEMSDEDKGWYKTLREEQRIKFKRELRRARIDADAFPLGVGDPEYEYKKPGLKLALLRGTINALRQAATSALQQPTGGEHYDAAKGAWVKDKYWYQSKAEAVIEILAQKDPEEKVLIFSEYPNTLRAIQKLLPDIGLHHRSLIGSTSAAGRGKAIKDFQTDPPTKVFLLTYRAGGAGVTLTAGTKIILCEPVLNPSFERQAIGRSHRMGQTKPITVIRMLMKGTIEEQVAEFMRQRVQEEGEDPEEMPTSTAMEANPASNDETNKLSVEQLNEWVNFQDEPSSDEGEGDEYDGQY